MRPRGLSLPGWGLTLAFPIPSWFTSDSEGEELADLCAADPFGLQLPDGSIWDVQGLWDIRQLWGADGNTATPLDRCSVGP